MIFNTSQVTELNKQIEHYQAKMNESQEEIRKMREQISQLKEQNEQIVSSKTQLETKAKKQEAKLMDVLSQLKKADLKSKNEHIEWDKLIDQLRIEINQYQLELKTISSEPPQHYTHYLNKDTPLYVNRPILSVLWERDRERLNKVQTAYQSAEEQLTASRNEVASLQKAIQAYQRNDVVKSPTDNFNGNLKVSIGKSDVYEPCIIEIESKKLKGYVVDRSKSPHFTLDLSNINVIKPPLPDSDTFIVSLENKATPGTPVYNQIKMEEDFIRSTQKTLAARSRFMGTEEWEYQLKLSMERASDRITSLHTRLSKKRGKHHTFVPSSSSHDVCFQCKKDEKGLYKCYCCTYIIHKNCIHQLIPECSNQEGIVYYFKASNPQEANNWYKTIVDAARIKNMLR
ncbi:hypothetical protein BDB01DRAFT_177772 [Pilobolus umbonatus]|nr:hypothetical protein BDB01DRAFT_177772 [Pilobolus umbonatus]